jgi:cytochrome c-type biogenesis protein CcmH
MLGSEARKLVIDDRHMKNLQRRDSAIRMAIFVMFTVLALLSVFPVSAQEPTRVITDDEVNNVARDLFCPICESTPLDVCETQACKDWRQTIRDKLASGQSDDQIKDYFADQYGVRALAEPPAEGITLPLWLVPLLAIPVAVVLFGYYLKKIRRSTDGSLETAADVSRPATDVATDPDPDQDPYEARIERELRDI